MEGPQRRRALWTRAEPWFALVTALASVLLLVSLGDAEFRPYDEGLYGKLARNALVNDRYLHAVGPDGEFFSTFSKPPFSIWATAASLRVFGMSLTALRVPFALSMLLAIWVAFGWGRRIGGLPMAVGWSGALALSSAVLRWGRHACIEPMFIAFVMLGLWAYHEAYRGGPKALRWAALAGVALALAFLTKQLAVGIAVLPILVLEVWRRQGRDSWRRLALALGIPTLLGGIWLALAYAAVGGELLDTLFTVGVKARVEGFAGGHNARSLNELAKILGEATSPWPWPLGVAGLALLAVRCVAGDRRHPDGAILLPLLLVTAVIVLENVANSMLPWYAFGLVPPITAGLGFAIAGTAGNNDSARDRAVALVGWAALGLAAVVGMGRLASQLNAALIVAAIAAVALLTRRGSNYVLPAAWVGTVAVLLASVPRDREFRRPAALYGEWMALFAKRGIEQVAVARKTGLVTHAYGTYFGPKAKAVRNPPWPTTKFDAYVTDVVLPTEFTPPEGIELLRAPGVSAFVGDLDQRGFTGATMKELLEEGQLTYEAEHLGGEKGRRDEARAEASGGFVRRHVPYRNEKTSKFVLSNGPSVMLPPGGYETEVFLSWDCRGSEENAASLMAVDGDDKRVAVKHMDCDDESAELQRVLVLFRLKRTARVKFRVVYRAGDVSHDRTVIRRVTD